MKPIIASTGCSQTVSAATALLSAGSNAIDAAVGALLAWPSSLMASGVMVAVGSGVGHGAVLFPARVPGFGLSRSRRLRLLSGQAPASTVATPCSVPAMASVLARWGTITIIDAVRAALLAYENRDAPHREALDFLEREGVAAFSRGPFAGEVARSLGPLEGGLLTRRDMIEARPEICEAQSLGRHLWGPWSREEARRIFGAGDPKRDQRDDRIVSIVIIDYRGVIVSASLEAGPNRDSMPATIAGVSPNTLLGIQTAAQAKKVGQALPMSCGVAVGGDKEQIALAGNLKGLPELLDEEPSQSLPVSTITEGENNLLMVRRAPGGGVEIEGASFAERS